MPERSVIIVNLPFMEGMSHYHKRERKPTIKGKSNYVLESALPLKYMTINFFLCEC